MPSLPKTYEPSDIVKKIREGKAALLAHEEAVMLEVARGWARVQDKIDLQVGRIMLELSDLKIEPDRFLATARELDRYNQLQITVAREALKYQDQITKLIIEGQRGAVSLSVASGKSVMDTIALTPLFKAQMLGSFSIVPVAAMENLLFSMRPGAPLGDLISSAVGEMAAEVQSGLVQGLALGYSNSQIVKLITDKVSIPVNRMMNITATELNRAGRFASSQFYRQSSGIDGFTRLSAHSSRTCPACLFRDGEFYPIEKELEDHPRGRCTLIPHFATGPQIPTESGQQWFEKQTPEFQQKYLGDQPYALWKSGQIQLKDLAGNRHNPIWGDSPRTLTLKEIKELAKQRTPGTFSTPTLGSPPPVSAGLNSKLYSGIGGETKTGMFQNKHLSDQFEKKAGVDPNYMSLQDKGKIKDEIVNSISQRSGMPYEQVNEFIRQWASTANDTDLRALSIQKAISDEFGVPMSKWQAETYKRMLEGRATRLKTGLSVPGDMRFWGETLTYDTYGTITGMGLHPDLAAAGFKTIEEATRAGVKAVYDYTQEKLRDLGIKEVTLFRGIGSADNIKDQLNQIFGKGGWTFNDLVNNKVPIDISTNAASSYATQEAIAQRFGRVTQITVPVERIYSTAMTGQGCFSEWEVIVLGSDFDQIILRGMPLP